MSLPASFDAKELTADLRGLLAIAEADLRERSERADLPWAAELREQYDAAFAAGRTALSWSQWRDGEVAQGAVAWVLGTVFVRFCEDNDLVAERWIAGPGQGLQLAVDAESAFYADDPRRGTADWLREAFAHIGALPASGGIFDPDHSPVWSAPLGDDACRDVLLFWRQTDADGATRWRLDSDDLDTRFLGDLYQDLSELAKKKYALLQTPDFVEEFILDRTLTPALAEFGLPGFRLIDPTCGSGHFLLGAFRRLLQAWQEREPGAAAGEHVRLALASVYGVDVNPFAAAIARFRLAVAALQASGWRRLADAPNWTINVAIGDSLLGGASQGALIDDEGAAGHHYRSEDITEFPGILESGRYHVVVGNPPYITVKDKALNEAYRQAYPTCHRQVRAERAVHGAVLLAGDPGCGRPAGGLRGANHQQLVHETRIRHQSDRDVALRPRRPESHQPESGRLARRHRHLRCLCPRARNADGDLNWASSAASGSDRSRGARSARGTGRTGRSSAGVGVVRDRRTH